MQSQPQRPRLDRRQLVYSYDRGRPDYRSRSPHPSRPSNSNPSRMPRATLSPSKDLSKDSSKLDSSKGSSKSGAGKSRCLDKRVRLSRVIVAVAVGLLLVGVLIAIIFVTVIKEENDTDNVDVHGEIKLTNLKFTNGLLDPESNVYKSQSEDFCDKIDNTLGASELASKFTGCEVLSYRDGSIIVSFIIHLTRKKSEDQVEMAESIKSILKQEVADQDGVFVPYQAVLLHVGLDPREGVTVTSPTTTILTPETTTTTTTTQETTTTTTPETTTTNQEIITTTTPHTATTRTTPPMTTTTTTPHTATTRTTTPMTTTTTTPASVTSALFSTTRTASTGTTRSPGEITTTTTTTTATTTTTSLGTTTTEPLMTNGTCRLPWCFRPHSGIPGGLSRDDTPMLVYLTFDDAIGAWNNDFYEKFFHDSRQNPDGCPIRATFFNSYNYTVYSLVKDLYEKGHELASHSITHRTPTQWWVDATKEQWREEIAGQRQNIHEFGGVPIEEIRGMRAPYLQIGGDVQFTMLKEENFMYDATMSSQTDPPSWPFSLHYPEDLSTGVCSINPCPTLPHSIWEVPLNILHMDYIFTPKCAMIDGCRPRNKTEALTFLWDNFNRHYTASTKPAFGLNMHAAWFAWPFNAEAMDEFIAELAEMEDVWIVPIYKVLKWVQYPTPISQMMTFEHFQC